MEPPASAQRLLPPFPVGRMVCGPWGREGACISGTPAFFGAIFNSFPQEGTCLNGDPLPGASPVDLAVSMQTSDPAKGGAHPAPVALGLGGLFCVCPQAPP